ncbi:MULTISPECIES: (d)CMP kinase [Spongiibacter]|jgi:cytidylate kinase|nr:MULTISPECIES: (d)CMP kinase [Spongiibacter]MAY39592.1 (d)CMP kinase [Spongiibacter sp.]MBI59310.1 (d)CMP kinase [Spongiibacter sp.]|tara:strand:+ start:13000 stop:13686 length:687 start_codon:yes stop_codon:yes gene_type:complete
MAVAPVICIDGPSGSGKGTLCQMLALELGWHLLDSGALYRLVGMAADKRRLDFGDEAAVAALAADLDVAFLPGQQGEPSRVMLDGVDVSGELRTETTGMLASRVAVLPAVREALLQRQRDFAQLPGLVADGRDMGTVVFPDAPLKVFLTASAEERARRRFMQLKEKGDSVNLAALLEEIRARDKRDSERQHAPLKAADDALLIDSSDLGIQDVFERVMAQAKARFVAS